MAEMLQKAEARCRLHGSGHTGGAVAKRSIALSQGGEALSDV